MTQLRYILLYITMAVFSCQAYSQGINVRDFILAENDLTANQAGSIVYDQNGNKCALLKIQTTQTGFVFDVGSYGITKTEQRTGEIWVYVPQGVKHITIQHPHLGTIRDYMFPVMIESAKTYVMELTTGITQTVVKNNPGGNFLVVKIVPSNASLYIDEKLIQPESNGEYGVFLDYGKHSYKVDAASFSSEDGIFEIGDSVLHLNVTLSSTLANIEFDCQIPDAEIYVNKKLIGKGQWKGQLPAGKYLIEARKIGYRDYLESIDVKEKETRKISIPSLNPIYGLLKVNVKPIGTGITIDNVYIGESPCVVQNILVGQHKLVLKAPKGNEITKEIILNENEEYLIEEQIPDYNAEMMNEKAQAFYDQKKFSEAFSLWSESAKTGNAKAISCLAFCYSQGKGTTKSPQKAFEYWKTAAELGYPSAQFNLAICYDEGEGVSKDPQKTYEWFKKAAEQGDTTAQYNLGICYEDGVGVSKNPQKAFEWYMKAARQGDSDAQYKIGYCYENGIGVDENSQEAFRWYLKAAEQGDSISQYNVGLYYEDGIEVTKNPQKAFEWYMKAAKQGDSDAQVKVGYCYENGIGVDKNSHEAFRWYLKAAEQGDSISQYNVALFYDDGIGVSKDQQNAFKWYLKSAEQGYSKAQLKIGFFYEHGIGTSKNIAKAFNWYMKAAIKGLSTAQFNVGICFEKGIGTIKNSHSAFEWFLRSAEQDYKIAQFKVGEYYRTGTGTTANESKAFDWYLKAAEADVPEAQYIVALYYGTGKVVPEDLDKSIEWLKKSASNGYDEAKKILESSGLPSR